MKKIERIFAIVMLSVICTANAVFAVPVKVDEDSDTRTTTTQTAKPTATATSKPKSSPTATPTAKATSKATATAKATSTASPKSSSKPTASAEVDENDKLVLDAQDDAIVLETTAEPTLNIQNNSGQLENKKYLTKGGAFLWFLFTVIVSAIISFAIAYRFYVMGRRDNHLAAEIRALKRDIDNKMVGTIGGFSEYDISVTNNNRSYAKENSSINSGIPSDIDEENNEIYKKWENKINSVQKASENNRASYSRTTGSRSGVRDVERRRPARTKASTVSGKIKNVLNDIFPFDKK